MKATLSFAVLAIPLLVNAADLRVSVTNGPQAPATLYIALFSTEQAFAGSQAMLSQKVEMNDGAAQWVFDNLQPGRYAVKCFADQNGNAALDSNLFGLPTERYGFSNNARGRMGPPGFDAAAVEVNTDRSIDIELK